MPSPLVSDRRLPFLNNIIHLGLTVLLLGACGGPPIYMRTDLDGSVIGGTGGGVATGGAAGHGTGGSAGKGGSQGATGGAPATGGKPATGGTSATGGLGGTGGGASGGGGATATGGSGGVTSTGGTSSGGMSATGGTNTGGMSTGGMGTGGMSTGGAVATGGTSAGGSGAGGVAATGGTSVGGMGGAAGNGAGNSTTPAAIDCSSPSAPPSPIISDFNTDAPTGRWASSTGLVGSVFAYHADTSTATVTVGSAPGDLHLTAKIIANSYGGGGIVFDSCQAIGTYKSIRFSVSGTNNCPIWLQIQTFDRRPKADSPSGGCTSNCLSGSASTQYPTVQNISVTASPVTVALTSFSPAVTGTLAGQVVGVHWFLNALGGSACNADLHFDDITLVP